MANSRTTRPREPQDEELRTAGNQQPSPGAASTSEPVDQQRVAQRAYELFQMRGAEPGRDQEDWFAAERELKGAGE